MATAQDKPALITNAQRSRDEQIRIRQIRYGVMMGIRAILLIVAAILVTAKVPLLWLWLPICAIAMVVLPWCAVLIANDRLPKDDKRTFRKFSKRKKQARPSELASPERSRVIDVDS